MVGYYRILFCKKKNEKKDFFLFLEIRVYVWLEI